MKLSFTEFTQLCHSRLEKLFVLYLQNQPSSSEQLQQAMAYAVLNGGKRIRPLLVYATGYALDVAFDNLDVPAAAIELIHAYSLIHDDLPAMDNADLRRGKPSCHKAFTEAIAILAGDALQPLAFEIIASHPAKLTAEKRIAMIHILSEASGLNGMAAGQALDITGVNSLDTLTKMYQLKTGKLLTAAVRLGELASDHHTAPTLEKFAENIGFAFQLQDDLLDIESETHLLGKPQGIDAINHKKTYPAFIGIEKTREKIQEFFTGALAALEPLDEKADLLRELAHYLLQRKK